MNIGQRVREAREALGMQRTVLARRVGVAENTIYRIETGKRTPSIELLEGIARELRTEPAELLREPSPSAEALSRALGETDSAIMESVREVTAGMEDVQRALLDAERLRETARHRVEEAL